MWKILAFIIIVGGAIGAGYVWVTAGRAPGPVITITEPTVIGQTGSLVLTVDTPDGVLNRLDINLEQDGATTALFSLTPGNASELVHETSDRLRLTRSVGKQQIADLKPGPARITVSAVRPVLFGHREAQSVASHDIEVRLNPPQISVLSLHHFINHGGTEMVVYRVTPPSAASGVRVGEFEYPGFPASGAGIVNADPALRVAFFALLWDQDLNAPIRVFARDEVGNEGSGSFDHQVFPKQFRKSRIPIDDRFLSKVVPPILQNSTELRVDDPTNLLASFLRINSDLRARNNATISALAAQTSPEILWRGTFKQLLNTAVEAGFADQRTYVYNGEDIDHQVHLGFDLASVAAAPVLAANRGRVMHAGWLGIYGNCVILDHGMGLQSLYAHLSSIGVQVGDLVDVDAELGRSGSTGLAGGDHLHFTMLLGGNAITPIDWWSSQWIQDRVIRKLIDAGAPASLAIR